MTNDTPAPGQPPAEDQPEGLVDLGLRAAFAEPTPRPSVMKLLQHRVGTLPVVHLPEVDDNYEVPVRVDDEVRELRDPSGRYQILGELGRGGMGVVYKGRDLDLGRDVAMKVLRDEYASRPEILERFVEEAQIGGQLQHPGIVPVYELGLQHGERPYFAMKLIKGETLASLLGRRTHPGDDRRRFLGIFEQICQTLAYAHARRVVHRDLKPANVMIGSFGEVQVVDWGFAKVLPKGEAADERELRQSPAGSVIETVRSDPHRGAHSAMGSMLGTPAYMPPEQAIGDVDHMDQRSDVFGLGAILCEVLTGAPPYLEQDGDLVQQAARADLQRAYVRIERSGADAALIALCRQCLSPARKARPESARQVAEAVALHLTSVEERARAAQVQAAAAKVRARATVLLSLAAVLLLATGAGGYLYLDAAARERRHLASTRVDAAVGEANLRLAQARAAGSTDLSLWTRAVDAADQAERLAREPEIDVGSRTAVVRLRACVRDEQASAHAAAARIARDEDMRRRLLDARMPTDDDVGGAGYWPREIGRRTTALAAALREYLDGRDLTTMPAAEAAAALTGPLAIELAAAIDIWTVGLQYLTNHGVADSGALATVAHLRAVAVDLDPDPWRTRLRRAFTGKGHERQTLVDMTGEGDLQSLPVESLMLLTSAFWSVAAIDDARRVARAACDRYPTDFPCVFHFGLLAEEARDWALAATCFRIARALRPDVREAGHRLGIALDHLRDHEGELRVFRELVLADPDNSHWHDHLGGAHRKLRQWDAALRCHRRALDLQPANAATHRNLGAVLHDLGRFDDAVDSYERATALAPADARSWSDLGLVLRNAGRLDQAVASCRRAIELDDAMASGHDRLGLALVDQGKIDEAIPSHRRAVALDRTNATWNNLGVALVRQKQFDEGIDCLRRALVIDPGDADAMSNLGGALGATGNVDEGHGHCVRAAALAPDSPGIHNNLGLSWQRRGELPQAVASFRRALDLDQKYVLALVNLGNALTSLGLLDEAGQVLRRAIDADPRSAAAHSNLALVLQKQGERERASASYHRAIELDPEDPVAWRNLGLMLGERHGSVEAVERVQRAVDLGPEDAENHHSLGVVLARGGQFDQALTSFQRATAIDPKHGLAHVGTGNVLRQRGDLAGAIAAYERAVAANPLRASTHLHLGHALREQGRRDEAAACYRHAVDADAKDAQARYWLGVVLHEQDAEQALPLLQSSIDLDPGFAPARNVLGITLLRLNRTEAAIASFQASLLVDSDQAPAHFNLGTCHQRQGRFEAALTSLRRAQAIWAGQETRFAQQWSARVDAQIREVEGEAHRATGLLALGRGERATASREDFVAASSLLYRRGEHVLAVRTYERAIAAFPDLEPKYPHRYNAACSAVLAASGLGDGAAQLNPDQRAHLRRLAHGWLLAELSRWRSELAAGDASASEAQRQLAHCSTDTDFDGVRHPPALQALPESEAATWVLLWQDVQRAREGKAATR